MTMHKYLKPKTAPMFKGIPPKTLTDDESLDKPERRVDAPGPNGDENRPPK